MKRVIRKACDDSPVPEEQETEGQRQLHSLLLQQLDTEVNIDRCVAKKKCFAPAALYKPFGDQAAGVRSLAQFQALQNGESELANLRELGLTETEIELWRNRDRPESQGKNRGVRLAPEAREERLQVIREKMAVRAELLARPQRFSSSRALSRREMEIEKALFRGTDRCSYLTALYHQDENAGNGQQGVTSSNTMDSLYRDFLKAQNKDSTDSPAPQSEPSYRPDLKQNDLENSQSTLSVPDSCQSPVPELNTERNRTASPISTRDQSQPQNEESVVLQKLTVNQTIGSLSASLKLGQEGPVTISGRVKEISDDEIRNNRETEEGIRGISRFQNYQRGEPSNVLCVKNLSPKASLAQLVSLFSRFQKDDADPIVYRLLTGRLKGQAFITFCDRASAEAAVDLVNGYKLLDKPLVIEFGRKKSQDGSEESSKKPSTTVAKPILDNVNNSL